MMTTVAVDMPMYAAVIMDADTLEQLGQPLLASSSSASSSNEEDYHHHDASNNTTTPPTMLTTDSAKKSVQAIHFGAGIVTGILFSLGGFSILLQHWQDMNRTNVLGFSVAWSAVTSLTAYLLFRLLTVATTRTWTSTNSATNLTEDMLTVLEYCFAVGVFLGFCGACTVTDVATGMPWKNVVVTLAVAAAWAALMISCAVAAIQKNNDHASGPPVLARRRQGTVLPMVMVV